MVSRARGAWPVTAVCANLPAALFSFAVRSCSMRISTRRHCYALAASAGKEAGLNDLWACALTRHAFIGLYERRAGSPGSFLGLAPGACPPWGPGFGAQHLGGGC